MKEIYLLHDTDATKGYLLADRRPSKGERRINKVRNFRVSLSEFL